MPEVNEGDIDPVEVKKMLDRGDDFQLIDVREPHEYLIASIPTAKLIPLGDVAKRANELESIETHCGPLQDGWPQREGRRSVEGARV